MADFKDTLDHARLAGYIDIIQSQNINTTRLDGWFLAREIMMEQLQEIEPDCEPAMKSALLLEAVCKRLPINIRQGEIFAGTEDDAFARSYALINPEFKVETFEGYCDEDAVYNDITPDGKDITQGRIDRVRDFWGSQPYANKLSEVYKKTGAETREVVYFVERVTGHTIPDFRDAIHLGIDAIKDEIENKKSEDAAHVSFYDAMIQALDAAVLLSSRYSALAADMAEKETDPARKNELLLIAETCSRVPEKPARNLYEAIQSYIILWQVMNLEQSPNPFAFSTGNLDRVFQPFLEMEKTDEQLSVQLVRHLLAFFCVGDRNWAISQNIMAGGMDESGNDLTCDMSHIFLKAFSLSNYSQPNLSVKVHSGTPDSFYESIAEFMFNFGHSTPSFFNDPVVFSALRNKNIKREDMPLYAAAGCQEPLVMGKESANTTNSWLNIAKVLELAINDGVSAITGERIAPPRTELGLPANVPGSYDELKKCFNAYLEYFLPRMTEAANSCTEALSLAPVPFHSAFIGGRDTGVDMRSIEEQGMQYNGSGCLIHGLSNVADSFSAIKFIDENSDHLKFNTADYINACLKNFDNAGEMRDTVRRNAPRFGNNDPVADTEVLELQLSVSNKVNCLKNPLGNPFCADWSTPSTNMLYGYLTGATPDGRLAREILCYGVDPSVAAGAKGLLPRVASQSKLDYSVMTGGSAAALSINPDPLDGKTIEEKAAYLKDVVNAVFGFNRPEPSGMMYVYFNVFSRDMLLDVMEHPEKYPDPVLVRIHGQYGDARHLSPDILSGDVIPRLDPLSNSF